MLLPKVWAGVVFAILVSLAFGALLTYGPQGLRHSSRTTWILGSDDPAAAWLHGGSYLVARRINMTIEIWDRQALREQERVVGRTKGDGAPLSGGTEFTQPDFTLTGAPGQPLIRRRLPRPHRAFHAQQRNPDPAPRRQLRRRQR